MPRILHGPAVTTATRVHVVYLIVIVVLGLLLVAAVTQLRALDSALGRACSPDSVVARLDLTEWVPLCRGR